MTDPIESKPMTSERTMTPEQRVEDVAERIRRLIIAKFQFHPSPEVCAEFATAALAPAEARLTELEEHLSGVLHEADWMVKLPAINDIARAGIQGRFARARASLNKGAGL